MNWTELHARLLTQAFAQLLGRAERGAVAYCRCLPKEVVGRLAADRAFSPGGWTVWCVAGENAPERRLLTADRAVELREEKGDPVLFLVEVGEAGAGMDGVYSAAREVAEGELFSVAIPLAAREITLSQSGVARRYAERAVLEARKGGKRGRVPPWAEFDFLVQVAAEGQHPGSKLPLLGLWPVQAQPQGSEGEDLALSRFFVERLLGAQAARLTPKERIANLKLLQPTSEQLCDLEEFVRAAGKQALLPALAELERKPHLWVHRLRVESAARAIEGLEWVPWRTRNGRLAKWSGLFEEAEGEPPAWILRPEPKSAAEYSKLQVRWKARPERLPAGSVQYRVRVLSPHDEELAAKEVWHGARPEQKCVFSNDDFATLSEDAVVSARVVIDVLGNESVEGVESEEFVIRFGEPPEKAAASGGLRVRAFSEGLVQLPSREQALALGECPPSVDERGFLVLRDPSSRRSFRVFRPHLVYEAEQDWFRRSGAVGRWSVRVRENGLPAEPVEFHPIGGAPAGPEIEELRERVRKASAKFAEQLSKQAGAVGQVYVQEGKTFENAAKPYVLAWAALLEQDAPQFALANTVEVQSLSGRTIGLIVLPSHPLRVAWRAAYDSLLFHAVFEEGVEPALARKEFGALDGAMFPAFLPGLEPDNPFVFADTLGLHAVALVPAADREPKASVALLARCLGEAGDGEAGPTVGRQSVNVLAREIERYLDIHPATRLLHVHALRAGDGMAVARALGQVQHAWQEEAETQAGEEEAETRAPLCFVLELYPSPAQRGLAGRFLSEASEKRRTGAGSLVAEDRWLLESVSVEGGVNLPKLRWARRAGEIPDRPAHLAVAFDTLGSHVEVTPAPAEQVSARFHAFGLLSFFEREYRSGPPAEWLSSVHLPAEGEKHPAERGHTERLIRMHRAVLQCVARSLGEPVGLPRLRTVISPEKEESLHKLHDLVDWVITLDRNAALEYFDSPRDHPEVYDMYVIDCVPEREDLGCLQLITTTTRLAEVRRIVDRALDDLGLSHSRRNAEFLVRHLKAVSGRLAIRLTGANAPTAELIALALAHAHCQQATANDPCWCSLQDGFLVPLDDVQDLLPDEDRDEEVRTRKVRPDFVYVCLVPRKGLAFRFVEVKYRRHLRSAGAPELLREVEEQVVSLRSAWSAWYGGSDLPATLRSLRRAKLARALRFYAHKARRHGLPEATFRELCTEIDRMVERGAEYNFAELAQAQRGWIFCPEFVGSEPLRITPEGLDTEVFLFGPALLPDSEFRRCFGFAAEPAGEETSLAADEPGEEGNAAEAEANAGCGAAGSTEPELLLGNDVLTGTPVTWRLSVKGNPHLLIAGLPGMGKTTCLVNLCVQMVHHGVRPVIFSYHQDIDRALETKLTAACFLDPHRLGFNPLRVTNRSNPNAHLDVAGALRDIFLGIYPELGDVQGEKIRDAVKQSFLECGWGSGRTAEDGLCEPQFSRFVEILQSDPRPDRSLRSLLARLAELADYGFFETGATPSIWELEGPVVLRLHGTQSEKLQDAFAALVLYALYKDMFRRGLAERIEHALVLDEAHRAARLSLIPRLGKECRKYGIALVLASQEAKDFHDSLFSVVANYLVLRVNEADARALVRNVASSDQERVLVDRIKHMERFRALYMSETSRRPCVVRLNP